jgi:hypothetical protein
MSENNQDQASGEEKEEENDTDQETTVGSKSNRTEQPANSPNDRSKKKVRNETSTLVSDDFQIPEGHREGTFIECGFDDMLDPECTKFDRFAAGYPTIKDACIDYRKNVTKEDQLEARQSLLRLMKREQRLYNSRKNPTILSTLAKKPVLNGRKIAHELFPEIGQQVNSTIVSRLLNTECKWNTSLVLGDAFKIFYVILSHLHTSLTRRKQIDNQDARVKKNSTWTTVEETFVNGFISFFIYCYVESPQFTATPTTAIKDLNRTDDPTFSQVVLPLMRMGQQFFPTLFSVEKVLQGPLHNFHKTQTAKLKAHGVYSYSHLEGCLESGGNFQFLKGMYFPFLRILSLTSPAFSLGTLNLTKDKEHSEVFLCDFESEFAILSDYVPLSINPPRPNGDPSVFTWSATRLWLDEQETNLDETVDYHDLEGIPEAPTRRVAAKSTTGRREAAGKKATPKKAAAKM